MQNESLRSAHEALELSQARYHELFDAAPVGYIIADAAGVITHANVAVSGLTRQPCAKLIGRPLASFVSAADITTLQEHLQRGRWDTHSTCELKLSRSDASELLVRVDISPVPSRAADYLIVLVDMSERQSIHAALEDLNTELEARVAIRTLELEARNQQLEAEILARERSDTMRQALEMRLREAQRLESLGLVAGGIAHDFNNLLVTVLGNADLLLLEPGIPEDWREPLAMMRRAGRSASELTRQLLTFAGRGQLNPSAVRLPHVVADSMELLRLRVPAGVQLQIRIASDLPDIAADRSQVQQLITNLVVNALEAVGDDGLVVVETRTQTLDPELLAEFQYCSGEPGDYALLRVQDNGPGIDPVVLPRIFDPFFTTKFTGRGLGLATVHGIVQSHCGALRVLTGPAGTSFEIAFPLAERQRTTERPRVQNWTGSGSVLLVDDDDGVRSVVAQLLTRLGFDVTSAAGGRAGFDRLVGASLPFDFIVLDWMMPGFSGEQFHKALRQLRPTLPVVLVSGYSLEEMAVDDPYVVRLQKPMTLNQLADAIRVLTEDDAVGRGSLRLRMPRSGMD
jgi:PAS domain S-box-containing protein